MRCMSISVRIKIGQKIRQRRLALNLTQDGLAELTGIDYKYIQKIEGKKPPAVRIDTLVKIAKFLKIDLSKLMDFK